MPAVHAVYGPCDLKWGSWFDVPEPIMACYVKMASRIRKQRLRDDIQVALYATGRQMRDDMRAEFEESIEEDIVDRTAARQRAPKVTPGFLMDYGIRMEGVNE